MLFKVSPRMYRNLYRRKKINYIQLINNIRVTIYPIKKSIFMGTHLHRYGTSTICRYSVAYCIGTYPKINLSSAQNKFDSFLPTLYMHAFDAYSLLVLQRREKKCILTHILEYAQHNLYSTVGSFFGYTRLYNILTRTG